MPDPAPNFLDSIFADPLTLWAARAVVIAIAAVALLFAMFVVTSVAGRMRRGDLLTKFGPFEVSEREASAAVVAERDRLRYDFKRLQEERDRAHREVSHLKAQLDAMALARGGRGKRSQPPN